MTKVEKHEVLNAVTEFFLGSRDFNGIPANKLAANFGGDWDELRGALRELILEGDIGVIYADVALNPHVIRLGFDSEDEQIEKLTEEAFTRSCVYPRQKHLETVVDRSGYEKQPYILCLALGEPQLAYRSFDLSILEFYRNDPRYLYHNSDISGRISLKDEYYQSDQMGEHDQIVLQSFGFSYDDNLNRAVAVFLRYLSDLSSEHQQIWKAKELTGNFRLHPDYYRNAIIGDWGERVPIFDAFIKELWLLNQMATAMGRPPLFRRDFGEYGEEKPQRFGFLVRPTLEEFNSFVLLLDKMLSDNVNKDFFQGDVPGETEVERRDGKIQVQNKGTLQILDDWIRKSYRTDDWQPWDETIETLRKIRKLRQKPAHAIRENAFDQEYFKKQRELIIEAYSAARTLRMLLENHPLVKASNIEIPVWLREGAIWTY